MKNKIVIALLAILVLVLAGVAYLFSTNTLVSPAKFEKEITKVEETSKSDEVVEIEDDLDTTNLDNLDMELVDIEAELE
ncbi:MAG: hypothetical protein UR39_C0016G0003 [Candidatus Woesebacteria bacterium GW2011_GWA1_33_30]|uniref:Uncharacterized protein n=1 Tax=Candidatus Woesebacteria bacterium GW2011_GWA2_33_28 TaxID=1618561 RepID=A0A0F9ZUT8_9BACT|nr:MAG: hypothetical protein UR39_C0016G0003 [Candidatus Woesebacteria bacterium GW2011_GWA1_33_30]KKP48103.1 MAG: hypothetical protein UR38_C0002G0206 [Candidatus Woesebacteria bacterium GW2011_GWA2_33_28]KKP50189.1 MAG: hypothetical protein UR40_C0002G0206 [Microgenomates group bacterium GW2011_GWC1_33_32]KKP51959.1 MAG: hypothetical protein UR44_C0006G0205 [Candidatus Woesebacteria bacterium GW2011_GWB1_33_38]KKP58254.1 MAG: hypothetical protein UR48_C0006G0003 [Microgenomates group bacteriu